MGRGAGARTGDWGDDGGHGCGGVPIDHPVGGTGVACNDASETFGDGGSSGAEAIASGAIGAAGVGGGTGAGGRLGAVVAFDASAGPEGGHAGGTAMT